MQRKWLSLLVVPAVALTAMSLLSAGAPQRDRRIRFRGWRTLPVSLG